jgi:hypothetical protein
MLETRLTTLVRLRTVWIRSFAGAKQGARDVRVSHVTHACPAWPNTCALQPHAGMYVVRSLAMVGILLDVLSTRNRRSIPACTWGMCRKQGRCVSVRHRGSDYARLCLLDATTQRLPQQGNGQSEVRLPPSSPSPQLGRAHFLRCRWAISGWSAGFLHGHQWCFR